MQNSPTPDRESSRAPQPGNASGAPHRAGIPEVWGNVPPRNWNFTGREELLTRLDRLITSGSLAAVVPQAMHGLGGVGKTQIAIEYVYRNQEHYDVVWWIHADQEELIPASIAALATKLGLPPVGTAVEDGAGAALETLRRGIPFRRWLLIFDNAKGPESIGQWLPSGPGHTLITSRNPRWEDLAETIEVDVFSRAESAAFLSRRVSGIADADSDALAEALGDLPLVLDQAAALQVATGMPVSEYLGLLKDQQAHKLLARPSQSPVPASVALTVSVTQLRQTQPEAVELLKCCAFFGPEPIPRDVLREGCDVVTESLGQILRDPIVFSTAIGDLGRYSLVKVDVPGRTLQVHRLVQALVREDLSAQDRERFTHDVHLMIAAATPREPDDSSTWPRFVELLPHFGPAGVITCHDSDARLSIRSVIRYQYMTGGFQAAQELAETALREWSQDPQTAPRDLLAIQRHLGAVLRAVGKYREAFEVNAAAMAAAADTLGRRHEETLRVTNSHGADLRTAGDFQAARALDEDSVARHMEEFGDQDRNTLRAQNNLALDLALLGDFRAARQLQEYVFQVGKKVYGSDTHVSSLASLTNLSRYVCLSGEYSDAYDMAEDIYAACLSHLGPNHPVTLRAARNLMSAERLAKGTNEETIARAVEFLRLHEELHGKRDPTTIAAATLLVSAWREAGQLDDAGPLAEQVADGCSDVYGPDHPFTHGCKGNLALLRRLSGDATGARELHEASLERLTELLGQDHYYALICAMGLAGDLAALKDPAGAKGLEQETVEHLRAALSADHPVALACAINLALDLRALSQDPEANRMQAEAIERYAQALGKDHSRVRAASDGQRLDYDFEISDP